MGIKRVVIVSLACLHLLALTAFVWTGFPETGRGVLASALKGYQNLSGCSRKYGYFAPSVVWDLRVAFLLEDSRGRLTVVQFTSPRREIAIRYDCIIVACMRNEGARDLFAQSWAALLLGSHPEARRVTVVTKALAQPSMAEYRTGKRQQWRIVYVGEFTRRKRS